MALQTSVVLRDRIAGFAEAAAGIVPCATRPSCTFTGASLACGTLASEPGYCACSGADKPIALPTTGGRPGFLWHGAQDTTVSVYYTCALDARMTARAIPHRVTLVSGDHNVSPAFMTAAWAYLSGFVR
jgi:predicted esterase